jgi:hypothetical protein
MRLAVCSLAATALIFAISKVWVQVCFGFIDGKVSDCPEEAIRDTLRLCGLSSRQRVAVNNW